MVWLLVAVLFAPALLLAAGSSGTVPAPRGRVYRCAACGGASWVAGVRSRCGHCGAVDA